MMVLMLFDQTVNTNLPVKENFRTAAEYLNERSGPRDAIIISPPFAIYPLEYYYRGPGTITTLPVWNRFISGAIPTFSIDKLPEEVDKLKAEYDRGWLLLSYDQGYENDIRSYFDNHFERLEVHQLSPGITLYSYRFNYDPDPLARIR